MESKTFAKIQLEVKVYEKKLYKKSDELRTLVKAALEKELKVPIIYQTGADVRIKIYVTKKGGCNSLFLLVSVINSTVRYYTQ